MVPSAPITAPAPVAPPEFDLQSNGHVAFAQKLPGKSNLKQTSTIPSTSSNGASSIAGEPHEDGQGEGERGSKVHWIDDYGKELTQVFEFEPRYEIVKGAIFSRHLNNTVLFARVGELACLQLVMTLECFVGAVFLIKRIRVLTTVATPMTRKTTMTTLIRRSRARA